MKYIKEKLAKTEPRVFESAKRLPKSIARDGMFSAKQRSDEKSAGHADDDNNSDPVQQAGDSSVNGALYVGDEAARQVGKTAKELSIGSFKTSVKQEQKPSRHREIGFHE